MSHGEDRRMKEQGFGNFEYVIWWAVWGFESRREQEIKSRISEWRR